MTLGDRGQVEHGGSSNPIKKFQAGIVLGPKIKPTIKYCKSALPTAPVSLFRFNKMGL
ncbi:hypothetical protein DPMN_064835 [Dreissena polymorpha]|uniref:Uncharacterized protein n=1 Tax=Dreissena polymorpha TaxID=45954 RepID=A0A9D4CCY8_DREPO|nr:hypothetical protein DPMN_064835 [Dreissena polymorpha]